MRKQSLTTNGFAAAELLIALAVIVVIGVVGGVVYHQDHKTKAMATSGQTSGKSSTQTNKLKQTTNSSSDMVSSSDLINVAKQVYSQVYDSADKLETVQACGTQNVNLCPFTADLISQINNAKVGPGDGPTLMAGAQQGPFGTIAYSAVPSAQGGTVTVNLTADSGYANTSIPTWKLTMAQSSGKLLVNDIKWSQTASDGTPACGPVEIYDYPSCSQ